MSIRDNLARVRERMATAADRVGRRAEEITLMAVTKTHPADVIREAYAAGQRVFGENRVQEFADKAEPLRDLAGAEFHLIGHLQSNKANKAAELFTAIDSLDSLKVAQRLNEAVSRAPQPESARVPHPERPVLARRVGKLPVLIEVNVGGEEQKSGLAPGSRELEDLLAAAPQFPNLEFRGLMTIPPYTEDPQDARPYFRALRDLRDGLLQRKMPAIGLGVLSMGMSHDFEVAIEEGSTCIRVGTAIFGTRSSR